MRRVYVPAQVGNRQIRHVLQHGQARHQPWHIHLPAHLRQLPHEGELQRGTGLHVDTLWCPRATSNQGRVLLSAKQGQYFIFTNFTFTNHAQPSLFVEFVYMQTHSLTLIVGPTPNHKRRTAERPARN